MAAFSKQWCEKNDPNMPWDFDILEVASKIEPLYGMSIICEGYGFTVISKDIDLSMNQNAKIDQNNISNNPGAPDIFKSLNDMFSSVNRNIFI